MCLRGVVLGQTKCSFFTLRVHPCGSGAVQAPHVHIDAEEVSLPKSAATFEVANKGDGDALFTWRCCVRQHASAASADRPPAVQMPAWLNIAPCSGVIPAQSSIDITVCINRRAAVAAGLSLSAGKATVCTHDVFMPPNYRAQLHGSCRDWSLCMLSVCCTWWLKLTKGEYASTR